MADDETKEKRAETRVGIAALGCPASEARHNFPQPAKLRNASTHDDAKCAAAKNESVRTRLESSDARRTALPRSLLKNYSTF
jgi:hypothetical protein